MKKSRDVRHLQDMIVGAAFLLEKVQASPHIDLSIGMGMQIEEFLLDAQPIKQAVLARPENRNEE